MNALDLDLATRAVDRRSGAPVFRAPFDAFDDDALLAHYRAPRAARYYAVADPDETQPDRIEALMQGHFEFNGETHCLPDPVGWLANPGTDLEWHILLHKFYYAVGLGLAYQRSHAPRYARRWAELIDGWIATVPAGFIAADVTGRRVQNWIYSHRLFVTQGSDAPVDPGFHRRLLEAIHEQVEYLCEHLTPKRNHRTLELYTIFLAGVAFPEMRRAAQWRDFGLRETAANAEADLLADGVHCELSSDYHHLALRNWMHVRRLAALNALRIPDTLDAAVQRALEFSLHVHKPDGVVPSLSDGDARSFLELLDDGATWYGREDMRYVATRGARGTPPPTRVAHFDASGYSIVRSGWGTGAADYADMQYLVFDCGPLGEGNHGHFDCLSFELAACGRSLIVDPGRYTYSEASDPVNGTNWRVHFRGTSAHNTVCVDEREQTRYVPRPIAEHSRHRAGSVRHKVGGPAPDTRLLERFGADRLDLLHGRAISHEYDAVHERCIVFVDRRYWIVSDWLRAPSEHDYALHFQLGVHAEGHTGLSIGDGLRVDSPGLVIAQSDGSARHRLCPGWVSSRYGEKRAAPKLQSRLRASDANFDTVLVPWRESSPPLSLRRIRATADGRATSDALHIELAVDGAAFNHVWFHARGNADACWHIGRMAFTGRWVHWREDPDGRVLGATSHAGGRLCIADSSEPIAINTGDSA